MNDSASKPISPTRARHRRTLDSIGVALAAAAFPCVLRAGPIAVIAGLRQLMLVYLGVMVVVSAGAIFLCRRIHSPLRRAVARLAILVWFYTPVPVLQDTGPSSVAPAFAYWPQWSGIFGSSGVGSQLTVMLLCCAIVFVLFLPLVWAWTRAPARQLER